MHNVGTTQLRSTSFYNAFLHAKMLDHKTFTYEGRTYRIKSLDESVERDLKHDFMNGFIDIKVVG